MASQLLGKNDTAVGNTKKLKEQSQMSIGRLDFELIAEPDLDSLIAAGVPEGMSIDYKVGPYGKSDDDKREFLKDVSSFANTAGGSLIIGMEASGGIANKIVPLVGIDTDAEILRLESLLRDGLQPRVTGVRIRAVSISSGGVVIVVRIPRSWNPPHRVSFRNSNRFFIRNSAGVHETSVDELRVLFNLSATALDRVRSFKQMRLAKISAGEASVQLANDLGKTVMHVLPLSAFASHEQIDVQAAYGMEHNLRPISSMSCSPRFNFEGFISVRGEEQCYGYTQLFRNGCIEAIKVRPLMVQKERLMIPSLDFDKHVLEALPRYLDALRDLNVPPPFVFMLTLDGVYGAKLGVERSSFDESSLILQSTLELPEIIIEDFGTAKDYVRLVRPVFDALWNAAGYAESKHFDKDDNWVGAK